LTHYTRRGELVYINVGLQTTCPTAAPVTPELQVPVNKNALRFLGRRLLLAAAVPPVMSLYRAYYRLVTRLAVLLLRRYRGVRAIYLRRGGALGKLVPWVSDLDFAVIVSGMSRLDREAMSSAYRRFAAKVIVADKSLEVCDESELPRHYEIPARQYRLLEGKATWRRLHGEDCLAHLPLLPLEKVSSGLYHEVKIWWTIFSWQLLQGRSGWDDPVQQNSVCYKVMAEVLKAELALFQGVLLFDRADALAHIKPSLGPSEGCLLEQLERIERERFRIRHTEVVEATLDFLLTYLNGFGARLSTLPRTVTQRRVSQEFDCALQDRFLHRAERDHARRLLEAARYRCGESCRTAYLLPAACIHLDELLLMIEFAAHAPPRLEELRRLCRFHQEAQRHLRSRVHLYLLLPHVALQVDADYHHRGWQSILCPSASPDVFDLLSNPEMALEGRPYAQAVSGAWSPLAEESLRDRRRACREKLLREHQMGLHDSDFVRLFWKALQLELVNWFARTERIVYPLTLPAIKRALVNVGVPMPERLAALEPAYHLVLDGRTSDLTDLISPAVDYVEELARELERR
jgi:hypothetical protein